MNQMSRSLFPFLIEITRSSAGACYDYVGQGEAKEADRAAVQAMRRAFKLAPIKGQVVIGEGERDQAPMLFIEEKVGMWGENHLECDIAVDPLEGTNFCAKGQGGAISVLALSKKGGLLKAPDIYMEKLAGGPLTQGLIHINKSPKENIQAVAKALNKNVSEIKVAILNRPRHKKIIQEVYLANARVLLIEDGDLTASILTAWPEGEVDLMMGTGGAPEGVLSASALKCLGGVFQGRLVFQNEEQKTRALKMGIDNLQKIYDRDELAKSAVLFCATGVTTGPLLKGVKKTKQSIQTNSLYMSSFDKESHTVSTHHIF